MDPTPLDPERPLLPPEAVIWAYRLLLGREPQEEELARDRRHESAAALRQALSPHWYKAPAWLLAAPESPLIPWRFEPPRISRPTSQLCTAAQFDEPEYRRWCATIGEAPQPHRKQWEFCWILAIMREADVIRPGTRALGFGVGREPLASVLAANGVSVVATDAPEEIVRDAGWDSTGQHAANLMHLHRPFLVDEATFRAQVSFRTVDMNAIPDDLRGFDVCWSSCCFEHLGSIEHGLRFFERSLDVLRPGGFAVHTTEFNLGSNDGTLESPGLSFYRRRDLEALLVRLAEQGHKVWPLNLHPGDVALDQHVDTPPYALPHFKLEAHGHVCTSIGLVVQKARHPLAHPMEPFYALSEAERLALTRSAHAENIPLMSRWADLPQDTGDLWSARAAQAAECLRAVQVVADIGCGAMGLERHLAPGQTYVPVDVVARDDRTIVVDLNRTDGLARLPPADGAAVLGVLEYIYHVPRFLAALRIYPIVVASFNLVTAEQTQQQREAHGWVVHFDREQLIDAFVAAGFVLREEKPIDGAQVLFEFT